MKSNPPLTNGRLRQDAFTLIELLIAIAIVMVLCILAITAGSFAVERSKQVKCMGHLRSFGSGLFGYLADHNQTFPKWTNNASKPTFQKWLREGNYIHEELRCPLVRQSELNDKSAPFRYTGNGGMLQYIPNITMIPGNRARVVLAAELYHGENGFTSPTHFNMTVWGASDVGLSKPNREEVDGTARRSHYHGSKGRRGLNLFMLDGHIEYVVAKDNDWSIPAKKGGVLGDKDEGYIYWVDSFRLMRLGALVPN